jgi:hypothetical protein
MVRLRQRLDQYAAENPSCMRVTVPRGEYLVRFEPVVPSRQVQEVTVPPAPTTEDVAPAPSSKQVNRLVVVCWLLGLAVLLLTAALLAMLIHSRSRVLPAQVTVHPLWSSIFQPHRTTTFVAADSGLVLLHWMTEKDTSLTEYLSRDFSQETRGLSPERAREVLNMANRRYTSFVDLKMFHRLQQMPFVAPGKLEVRYARDVEIDELKQGNVILWGARGANPWIELYEPRMNFVGSDDWIHHTYSFINRHPQAGEPSEFSVSGDDPKQRVMGVLAFLPNLDGSGNALIIEGNSMAGAEAIGDFLFDDADLLSFLSKLRKSDGSLSHFEVLLESNSLNGSAGPFRILAYCTHP